MNPKIVARKAFFFGFLLGVVLFFIPQTRFLIIYFKNLFYPYPVNIFILYLLSGLLTGSILDICYLIYLKEGRMGLIRVAAILGIFILLLTILGSGLLGSHVLYF